MVEKKDMKVRMFVWYKFFESGYRMGGVQRECAAVITYVDDKHFKLFRLDTFKETNNLRMNDVQGDLMNLNERNCITAITEQMVQKYLSNKRLDLVNEIAKAQQALNKAEAAVEDHDDKARTFLLEYTDQLES